MVRHGDKAKVYPQDLSRGVPEHIGLVGEVPGHDGGVVSVQHPCEAVAPVDDGLHVGLESAPAATMSVVSVPGELQSAISL